MIALITSAISEKCIGSDWELKEDTVLEKPGDPFKSEREDCLDLKLILRK
jgi:hypothetical protein